METPLLLSFFLPQRSQSLRIAPYVTDERDSQPQKEESVLCYKKILSVT